MDIRYIELKTGYNDNGPAWIARVRLSKSRTTIYFGDKALMRGSATQGNYFDSETGEEYWVSAVKKDGTDRHSAGGGIIMIEEGAVAEYLLTTGLVDLIPARHRIVPDLPTPDPQRFVGLFNKKLA